MLAGQLAYGDRLGQSPVARRHDAAVRKLDILQNLGNCAARAALAWNALGNALRMPLDGPDGACRMKALLHDNWTKSLDHSEACKLLFADKCPHLGIEGREEALDAVRLKRLSRHLASAAEDRSPQAEDVWGLVRAILGTQALHPHSAVTHLLFLFWIHEADGRRLKFAGATILLPDNLGAAEKCAPRLLESILVSGAHDFKDYDAAGARRTQRALEDLALLWAHQNESARPHLEAAAAAGHELCQAVVRRLSEFTESGAAAARRARALRVVAAATAQIVSLHGRSAS